jgi:Tol biopolymer transport system component
MKKLLLLCLLIPLVISCDLVELDSGNKPNQEDVIYKSENWIDLVGFSNDGNSILVNSRDQVGIIDVQSLSFRAIPNAKYVRGFSSDNSRVLYTTFEEIRSVGVDGSDDRLIFTDLNLPKVDNPNPMPIKFFEDNQKILVTYYLSGPNVTQKRVGVVDVKSGELTQLTEFISYGIDVSEELDKILLTGFKPVTEEYGIWLINTDGSDLTNISDEYLNDRATQPVSFTADGKDILYRSANGFGIFSISEKEKRIIKDQFGFVPTAISPDKEWVAYYKNEPIGFCGCSVGEVFLINTQTSEIKEVRTAGDTGKITAFSKDSKKILYTSSFKSGKVQIYLSDIEGLD